MRITKSKLKNIIKEEANNLLKENWLDTLYDVVAPKDVPSYIEAPADKISRMAKHGAQPWEHMEDTEDAYDQAKAAAAMPLLVGGPTGIQTLSGGALSLETATLLTQVLTPLEMGWLMNVLSGNKGDTRAIGAGGPAGLAAEFGRLSGHPRELTRDEQKIK